jgi:hypothetical protein
VVERSKSGASSVSLMLPVPASIAGLVGKQVQIAAVGVDRIGVDVDVVGADDGRRPVRLRLIREAR